MCEPVPACCPLSHLLAVTFVDLTQRGLDAQPSTAFRRTGIFDKLAYERGEARAVSRSCKVVTCLKGRAGGCDMRRTESWPKQRRQICGKHAALIRLQ